MEPIAAHTAGAISLGSVAERDGVLLTAARREGGETRRPVYEDGVTPQQG